MNFIGETFQLKNNDIHDNFSIKIKILNTNRKYMCIINFNNVEILAPCNINTRFNVETEELIFSDYFDESFSFNDKIVKFFKLNLKIKNNIIDDDNSNLLIKYSNTNKYISYPISIIGHFK